MAIERELDEDESSELASLLLEAYALLPSISPDSTPDTVIAAIKLKIEELRVQKVAKEDVTDIAFPLGYLYGEQLRKSFGWDWRYVTQDNGFQNYSVVSPDKSFVCFSIKCVYDLLLDAEKENSSRLLFNMIKAGNVPQGQPGRYQSLSF